MTLKMSFGIVFVATISLVAGCGQPEANRSAGAGGGGQGDGAPGAGDPGAGGGVGPGSDSGDRDPGVGGGGNPGGEIGGGEPGGDDTPGVLGHGSACAEGAACLGGTCLNLPGGYCTELGCAVDAECGDGAVCVEVDSSGLRACLAACDQATFCREGYGCSPQGSCLPGIEGPGDGDPGDGGDIDPGDVGPEAGDPGDGDPGDNVDHGRVGSACQVDAECMGPEENRVCLSDDDGFTDGYCTLYDCRPGSCPAGSACFQVSNDGLTACLDDCSRGCRDGYECRGNRACMPIVDDGEPGDGDPGDGDPGDGDPAAGDPADGDPGDFGSPVGGECLAARDCALNGATCLSEDDGFLGGYCVFLDCGDGDCPAGSDCFQVSAEGDTACLATCDAGCRDGYECVQGLACMPSEDGPGDGDPGDAGSPVGGECGSDDDCAAVGATCLSEAQGFVGGYCSLFNCDDGCPGGSECFQVAEDGTTACLATCDGGCREGYACEQGLACMPEGDGGGGNDDPECEVDQDCEGAEDCINGNCVVPVGDVPAGPGPNCVAGQGEVTDWRCDGGERVCGEILNFDPDRGPGWWDYPLNGETERDQYRSWIRRDVMQLVKYGTSMVECQSADWNHGNFEPLGLGDMSERNGAIPGTRDGQPGHPQGTHVNGRDMDIAYFQVGTRDNILRAVCTHTSRGQDQYHCVREPENLDPWRTALFIAHLHESPQLRVIGVDGRIGVTVEAAVQQLCAEGYIAQNNPVCRGRMALAFETVDEGRGWFRFHHHHLHISLMAQGEMISVDNAETVAGPDACITLDCSQPMWSIDADLNLP